MLLLASTNTSQTSTKFFIADLTRCSFRATAKLISEVYIAWPLDCVPWSLSWWPLRIPIKQSRESLWPSVTNHFRLSAITTYMALHPAVELSIPFFGRLTDMISYGYLAQTFGPSETKRYFCHVLLRFVEDEDDLVISHELLRPEYSYTGLPGSFSIPYSLYLHVQCNSVAGDGTFRIILDYNILHNTLRVVPQKLFAPYAGLPRSQAELQNASLNPPIFFIRLDNSVGLPLETAKSADAEGPLLRYSDWHPMAGKASIKLRLSVRLLVF